MSTAALSGTVLDKTSLPLTTPANEHRAENYIFASAFLREAISSGRVLVIPAWAVEHDELGNAPDMWDIVSEFMGLSVASAAD